MKCKDCPVYYPCVYKTLGAEQQCPYFSTETPHIATKDTGDVKVMLSPKALWISETAVKLLADIPYEYVGSGVGGQVMEARHIYAARVAKEMADVIFGDN